LEYILSDGIDVSFSGVSSPVPGDDWVSLTRGERIDLIKKSIQDFALSVDFDFDVDVVEANEGGQISVIINNTLSADERGPLLLNIERFLKLNVDNGITVWHAPIGDKSSLRNLRGIEVLS
jgi:hypothetical protein